MVKPLKSGELLVKEGFVRMNDIEHALSLQSQERDDSSVAKHRLIGMILCDLNLMTPVDTFFALHKYNKIQSLDTALVASGMVAPEKMATLQKLAAEKGLPLISFLLKTGQVETSDMQKMLYDLYHVPFKSIKDIHLSHRDRIEMTRILEPATAGEKQVVPLMIKDHTILFGITSPDNMLLIHELSERFPQYRFNVVFIPFWGFSRFSRVIYDLPSLSSDSQKPLDLSLLLTFRAKIEDPLKETALIHKLYHRYEQLLHLSGKRKRENRMNDFYHFIRLSHEKICKEFQCGSVEFSLKKADNGVKLIALPKK